MPGDVNLFNPHDGLTGRDGGPYLDQEERRLAEIVRSAKEDRKPDFDNAPATAGTPLVTASELVGMANPASIPSQSEAVGALTNAVETLAKDESFPVSAFTSRDETEAEKEAKRLAESNDPHDNPANPSVISRDSDEEAESVKDSSKETAKKASPAKRTTKKATAKKAATSTKTADAKAPGQSPK